MPTSTYISLANTTLTGTAASVTFSSISQAYKDIVLVMSCTATSTTNVFLQPNNSSYPYAYVAMGTNGSSGFSGSDDGNYEGILTTAYTIPDTSIIWTMKADIMDYSSTDKHKTFLIRNGGGFVAPGTAAIAGRWKSTDAMTSLVITAGGNSFASGSSFAIYGIAA